MYLYSGKRIKGKQNKRREREWEMNEGHLSTYKRKKIHKNKGNKKGKMMKKYRKICEEKVKN